MKLDFFTLYISIVLTSIAFATVWGMIGWRYRARATRIWFAACVLITLGGVILPFQHTQSLAPFAAASGNGLIIFGFWLFWLGLRSFHNLADGWPLATAASVFCMLLTILLFGHDEALALIYAFGQSTPMLLSLALLLRRSPLSTGAILSCAGIAIGLTAHGIVIVINFWLLLNLAPFTDFFALAGITMQGIVFSGILWNFGFAAMAIDRLLEQVSQLANVDPLTGAWNRRKFDEQLAVENARSQRTGRPYALALMDLDHFKAVNDQLGHNGGDQSLIHFVGIVKNTLRKTDLLARLGGDEFCVLMPDATEQQAHALGKRIAQLLDAQPLCHQGQKVQLTCSIGIAAWTHDTSRCNDAVMSRADDALYAAKAAGRNKITAALPAVHDDLPSVQTRSFVAKVSSEA